MFTDKVFVGVDPSGGRKPFLYAALDASGNLLKLSGGELEDVLTFISSYPAAYVAINAPQRPNQGLVREARQALPPLHTAGRSADMRLAEYQLREHGINVAATPSRAELCSGWIQAGFEFYRRLDGLGFKPYPADGAERWWVETHPQACFAVLAGQVPLPKPTLEGRLQRQLLLYEEGLNIHDPMDFFEELTRHKLLHGHLPLENVHAPEELDALAAAFVAYQSQLRPTKVIAIGDADEGQIVLPVAELNARY